MSQVDIVVASGQGGQDGPPPPTQPLQGESNTGESSGLFFSIYSKAAEDEDNKMVDRWQNDAKGILIFTGLFSAAVAALLVVTIQDLRPNSQDISAFYLGNIYQVLADPNITRSSIPPPVATPPSFSPPRYAIWVNSLWFLSLVISLSCALLATLLQQWARQYLSRARPARCRPEKRARMRQFFSEGVDKMHIPWAVEGLPMLVHLSLFLFFGGVAIFLFNNNREVFGSVVWWICIFALVYGLITLMPILRPDSPYYSPLSTTAWLLSLYFILSGFPYRCRWYRARKSCYDLSVHFLKRMFGRVEKAAEEMASERTSGIDVKIFDWTVSALDDDDLLKKFFETIPRSFDSEILQDFKRHISLPGSWRLREKTLSVLQEFCRRTLSSHSISDSEKVYRLDISNNAMKKIDIDNSFTYLLSNNGDHLPQTVEMGHAVARWFTDGGQDILWNARDIINGILVNVRERNDSWLTLAAWRFGLPERDLRNNITFGNDSVLLALMIHVIRGLIFLDSANLMPLEWLFNLDIRNSHPRLQHDFCAIWNEIVRKARNRPEGHYNWPVKILKLIRLPYITLHQDTNAFPTAFDAFTSESNYILRHPLAYPFCNLASHHPNSTAHVSPTQPSNPPDPIPLSPNNGGKTASQQAEQVNNTVEAPLSSTPMTTSELRATFRGPDVTLLTNPTHSSSHQTSASLPDVMASALKNITLTITMIAPSAEPGNSQILSTPSATRPTGSATLSRLHARGLAFTNGDVCFGNTVLQVLANSPPPWNLFRELAELTRQRGTGIKTGGGATPLVDATMKFFEEYMVKEQSQAGTGGTSRADGDNFADSFEPSYLYDALKENKQFGKFFERSPNYLMDAGEFLSQYLDALDEEIPALFASISGSASRSASTALALDVEERETSQLDHTKVESQDSVENLVKSPITHIFGGKFRLPIHVSEYPNHVALEHWRSLHLDIQSDSVRTIQDALINIHQPQFMQVGPSDQRIKRRQMPIVALPPVLVLHLKRFQQATDICDPTKICKPIQFSTNLEIPFIISDIMVLKPRAGQSSQPPRYKLFGVLHHHGESADNGHYTVDVLRPNGESATGEEWLHIDDDVVTRMGPVFKFGEYGLCVTDEQSAYILFYVTLPK